MAYLSIALNYHFHMLDLFGYHVVNLTVHLISSILVFWLTLLTLSAPKLKDNKITEHANTVAFFVGLIFLTHPIQTQSVTYITQRATSLATLFYLASVTLYAKSGLSQLSCIRRRYYFGSFITALLAMLTKEMTITLPFAILLYEVSFLKTKRNVNWRRLIPFFVLVLAIPLTMFLTKSVDLANMKRTPETSPGISPCYYLLTQFRVIITYLRLLFIPLNQNIDYDYPISKTLLEWPAMTSLILLISILLFTVKMFSRHRVVSFGVFWFFLTLIPESSMIPIRDVICEHRLYLPMVGYGIFLVSIIYQLIGKRSFRLMAIALLGISVCYSILAYARNTVWKDEFSLWNDAVQKSPKKARPHNNIGLVFENNGNLDKALGEYNKAIQLDPKYVEAYNNRGVSHQKKGNLEQAISDYNKAIEVNPTYYKAYNNRAIAYREKGDLSQAINDYTKAIQINPNYVEAYGNRAVVYFLKGDYDKSWDDVHKVEALGHNLGLEFLANLKKASARER